MHLSKHWLTVSTLKAVDVIQIEAFIISHGFYYHQNSTCLWKAISPLALIHSRILKTLRVYADYRFTQPLSLLVFMFLFSVPCQCVVCYPSQYRKQNKFSWVPPSLSVLSLFRLHFPFTSVVPT